MWFSNEFFFKNFTKFYCDEFVWPHRLVKAEAWIYFQTPASFLTVRGILKVK